MIAHLIILYMIISILIAIALLYSNGSMTPDKQDLIIISGMSILWPVTIILYLYATITHLIRKYRKNKVRKEIKRRYYEDLSTDAVIKVKGHNLIIKLKKETLIINTKTSQVKYK